jgi:hypothetical protein
MTRRAVVFRTQHNVFVDLACIADSENLQLLPTRFLNGLYERCLK